MPLPAWLSKWLTAKAAPSTGLEVLAEDVGIVTAGGLTPLIARGAQLPASFRSEFSTAEDGQAAVELRLSARGSIDAVPRTLGVFSIDGIPPQPRGMPRIHVTVTVAANGEVTVTAVDKDSARTWEARLRRVATTNLGRP